MHGRVAGFLVVACVAAGCTDGKGAGQPKAGAEGDLHPRAAASLPEPPLPKAKPSATDGATPAAAPAAGPGAIEALTASLPAGESDPSISTAPPLVFGLRDLVGLGETDVRRVLGIPAATQETPPAKTWQYATDACTLRMFFFMEMASQDFHALSYELKSSTHGPDVEQRCFAELLAQAHGEHGG